MFAFSLVVSLILSLGIHSFFFQSYYLEYQVKNFLSIYQQIEEQLYVEDLQTVIEELNYKNQVTVTIADARLRYSMNSVSHSRVEERRLNVEFHNLISKYSELLETTHYCKANTDSGEHPLLIFVKKLSDGNYCILTQPWDSVEKNMETVNEFHVITAIVACIVGICSTWMFAKKFTKPIIELNTLTEELSQLNFQHKITYKSKDELGQLAESINVLSDKLEANMVTLNHEIAFQKVLSQNMSHELKTPISVMKGYIEGLTYGIVESKEEQEEYLEIVLAECNRMTELIDRMLNLSKLTSFQGGGLEKSVFSTLEFLSKIQTQCDSLLSHHGMKLEEKLNCPFLCGNEDLLVQAVVNFISNAVKYGDKKKLVITISQDKKEQIISVFNTGNIIPVEEIDKIFDIFYMVDKARSRSLNSHGLGLSVSKTVAELHQGRGFCEEKSGEGMIFSIKFPKNEN